MEQPQKTEIELASRQDHGDESRGRGQLAFVERSGSNGLGNSTEPASTVTRYSGAEFRHIIVP
jgi:hypothetical protein